jgi:cytochrome c oxidase assembly protein subunit 15
LTEETTTSDPTIGALTITGRHCYLLLIASVLTYLLVTMGGIVCVTESGQGCPDWPGCYGRAIPPMRTDAIIEYTHRLVAALASPFIIAGAILGWRKYRSIWWVSRPPVLAVVLLLAVSVFGAFAVLRGLPPGLAAIDLGSALMVLAFMLVATVVAFYRRGNSAPPDRLSFRGSYARLALWALATAFIVLVSGVLVAESGSMVRCLGWPLYSGRLPPDDPRRWLQIARRLIAGLASISIVAVVVQAWRTQNRHAGIRRVAAATGVAALLEILVGALILVRGSTTLLLVVYVAAAAALWGLLVILVVLAGLASPTCSSKN